MFDDFRSRSRLHKEIIDQPAHALAGGITSAVEIASHYIIPYPHNKMESLFLILLIAGGRETIQHGGMKWVGRKWPLIDVSFWLLGGVIMEVILG